MPDRRETMAGYTASRKIEYDRYFTIPDYRENFSEEDIKIPAHYEVCPTCEGRGKHINPSIDSQGLTQADFDEQGEDFREDYFSGMYDVPCAECHGNRVVLVENDNLTQEQKEVLEAYNQALNEEASEIWMRNQGIQF